MLLPGMGQGKSKSLHPGTVNCVRNSQEFGVFGNVEGGSQEGSIPQDSPLGMIIWFWDAWGSQKEEISRKLFNIVRLNGQKKLFLNIIFIGQSLDNLKVGFVRL